MTNGSDNDNAAAAGELLGLDRDGEIDDADDTNPDLDNTMPDGGPSCR